MRKHRFKKSLGQNFLKHDRFAEKLIEPLNIKPGDIVLEVGPGDGRVTNLLLRKGARVLAIEKDYALIPKLIARFNNIEGFELENSDFLDITVSESLEAHFGKVPEFKATGSLPYNISKKIIQILLTLPTPPTKISFIVQEEVAKQYIASPPKATFLGNWASLHATLKKSLSIPASQFFPVPKVNGAILIVTPKEAEDRELLARFERLYRISFITPRKTLWNNLSSHWPDNKDVLTKVWEDLSLSPSLRAAEISLEDWTTLELKLHSVGLL